MPPTLKINFYDQHLINFERIDSMRPMEDPDERPKLLTLRVTAPRDASETTGNPLFGTRSFYTGYLDDGSTCRPVFIKWARSWQRVVELGREGDFYCSALRKLQGVVVPNFYGVYIATDHAMRELGCTILEQLDEGGISSGEASK